MVNAFWTWVCFDIVAHIKKHHQTSQKKLHNSWGYLKGFDSAGRGMVFLTKVDHRAQIFQRLVSSVILFSTASPVVESPCAEPSTHCLEF